MQEMEETRQAMERAAAALRKALENRQGADNKAHPEGNRHERRKKNKILTRGRKK